MRAASRSSPVGGQRRGPRWGTLAIVAVFHLLVIAGLIRVFAPDFTNSAARQVAAVLVTVTARDAPSPAPKPKPKPMPMPRADAGASAPQAKKAVAQPVSAPAPVVPLKPVAVPPVASTGTQVRSGSGATREGSGGGGSGVGTGSGASGNGEGGNGGGGGIVTKAVLISGTIDAAKDFPVPPGGRAVRVGRAVIVALTVGIDGRPGDCRVYSSSGLPDTDARTCELAMQRLRFRPATDARGEPVVSTFYWQQRFFR